MWLLFFVTLPVRLFSHFRPFTIDIHCLYFIFLASHLLRVWLLSGLYRSPLLFLLHISSYCFVYFVNPVSVSSFLYWLLYFCRYLFFSTALFPLCFFAFLSFYFFCFNLFFYYFLLSLLCWLFCLFLLFISRSLNAFLLIFSFCFVLAFSFAFL